MIFLHHVGGKTQGPSGVDCFARAAVTKTRLAIEESLQVGADRQEKRGWLTSTAAPVPVLNLNVDGKIAVGGSWGRCGAAEDWYEVLFHFDCELSGETNKLVPYSHCS